MRNWTGRTCLETGKTPGHEYMLNFKKCVSKTEIMLLEMNWMQRWCRQGTLMTSRVGSLYTEIDMRTAQRDRQHIEMDMKTGQHHFERKSYILQQGQTTS